MPILTTEQFLFTYESIDRSSTTSATPNAKTEVMAANADRQKWFFQNKSTTEMVLYRGVAGSEVEFLRLKGGDSASESISRGGINRDRISVSCAAASAAFIAWEGV